MRKVTLIYIANIGIATAFSESFNAFRYVQDIARGAVRD